MSDQDINKVSKFVSSKLNDNLVDVDPPKPTDRWFNDFSSEPIQIPLDQYIGRLIRLFKCDPVIVLLALKYIEKILSTYNTLQLTQYNIRRIVFIACMLVTKVVEDVPYSNKQWSEKSGTYSVYQVNKMEREMLILLNHTLMITKEHISEYLSELNIEIPIEN